MRLLTAALFASAVALLGAVACQPAVIRHEETATSAAAAAVPRTPLVLALGEGERRVRRAAVSAPHFILKVDRYNGGSGNLVMGYEDLPPGGSIPPHTHLGADEIIFVHRGSGAVQLGERKEVAFGPGATIYIPRNTRITLRNTGRDSLSIVFVFSHPGFEEYLRDASVREGEPVVPLSEAELATIRRRHGSHTTFER